MKNFIQQLKITMLVVMIMTRIYDDVELLILIQNLEFGCIQFNKIFVQLENPGIAHPYVGWVYKEVKSI